MTILIAVIHAGLAAAWVGGMAYSLLVVQPKLQRFFRTEEDSREALTAVIASGNRWKVLGLVAMIAATGLVLLWLADTGGSTRSSSCCCWWQRESSASCPGGTGRGESPRPRPNAPRCNASSECWQQPSPHRLRNGRLLITGFDTPPAGGGYYVLKLDVPT
jgi:hypothetical protein